jgi:hypothetical protein
MSIYLHPCCVSGLDACIGDDIVVVDGVRQVFLNWRGAPNGPIPLTRSDLLRETHPFETILVGSTKMGTEHPNGQGDSFVPLHSTVVLLSSDI